MRAGMLNARASASGSGSAPLLPHPRAGELDGAPLPHRRRRASGGSRLWAPAAAASATGALLLLLSASALGRGQLYRIAWPWPAARGNALTYPVWWFAPFYAGSGYGDEALSYVGAMLAGAAFRPADVWVTHAGDGVSPAAVRAMEASGRALLERQEYARLSKGALPERELQRPAIAICHTFPECWARGDAARGLPWPRGDPPMAAPGCPCPPGGAEEVAYRVGRTMYETAGLPQHLVDHCNDMDEVWVPTEFNRGTFIAAGVSPSKLRVVEEGINTTRWDPAAFTALDPLILEPQQLTGGPRWDALGGGMADASRQVLHTGGGDGSDGGDGDDGAKSNFQKPFVFLSVFKLEARKGWDVLLDAFLSEFTARDNVELHILTKPYPGLGRKGARAQSVEDVMWAWLARAKGLDRDRDGHRLARVYVNSGRIPDDDYPRLYLGADAVVLPTRGEGWGRPQMEAMALGRPLITTNWSGPTAYLSEEVAYPLDIDGLTPAAEDMNATDPDSFNIWFAGQRWAKPSAAHLKQLMRRVVERPDEAAARGAAARALLLGRFTPDVLAARLRAEVERIHAVLAARGAPAPRRREGGAAAAGGRRRGAPGEGDGPPPRPGAFATITGLKGRDGGGTVEGEPRSGGPGLPDLVARARAAGFSRSGGEGGFGGNVDTLGMMLAEVLEQLERPGTAPRTIMRLPPPQQAEGAAGDGGALGGPGPGPLSAAGQQQQAGFGAQHGAANSGGAAPSRGWPGPHHPEDESSDDEDDGSIVLHT
ncbi:MAG: hypothetical protein J3K34DRAFT_517089 [Monoraphidium minutum]|nr:MAG: hypothetical protein J3K34DRAFT_517089 [Monoraphidium minutum]